MFEVEVGGSAVVYGVTMVRQYVWMLLMQGAVQKPLADDQTMADGVVVVWCMVGA